VPPVSARFARQFDRPSQEKEILFGHLFHGLSLRFCSVQEATS
jgi:hypothetical protein